MATALVDVDVDVRVSIGECVPPARPRILVSARGEVGRGESVRLRLLPARAGRSIARGCRRSRHRAARWIRFGP